MFHHFGCIPSVAFVVALWFQGVWSGIPQAPPSQLSRDLKAADEDTRFKAAKTILNDVDARHTEAMGVLLRGLESEHWRHGVVWTLCGVASKNPDAIPILTKLLGHEDYRMRHTAVSAFRDLGLLGKSAIPALIKTLDDRDFNVCSTAAIALGNMGRHARSALPALKALRNTWGFLPIDAAAAMVQIDPGNEEGMHVLIARLGAWWNPEAQRWAASVLHRIDPLPESALPAVARSLRNGCANVRWSVAHAMPNFRSKQEAVVPHLQGALTDRESSVRQAAAEALGQLCQRATPALPDLIAALKDPTPEVRAHSAIALGRIGPAAKQALPSLRTALHDNSARVRDAAASALTRIEPDGDK